MKKLIILSLLAMSQVSGAATGDKIIYGVDNRKDVFQVKDKALLEVASATAAMVPHWKAELYQKGTLASSLMKMLSLEGSMNVCAGERFASQPAIANCSGFLVNETTLVTAGHCINETSGCEEYAWVFDYNLSSSAMEQPLLKSNNVYSCARVVRSILDPVTQMDYAVVELDRPVVDRKPLKFRRSGRIAMETPLVVIGHPSGLPTKIADGARVMEYKNNVFFRTNLDTYGGNSGSAVFNAKTLEVEGILVRGARDYVETAAGCNVSNVVPVDAATEAVTVITNVKEIKKL